VRVVLLAALGVGVGELDESWLPAAFVSAGELSNLVLRKIIVEHVYLGPTELNSGLCHDAGGHLLSGGRNADRMADRLRQIRKENAVFEPVFIEGRRLV